MAESDVLTYLQTPPRRPNLGDLHGGLIENDGQPLAGDPEANAMNQGDKLIVHAHELIEAGRIHVLHAAGTPSIQAVWPSILVAGDFVIADGGTGITTLTHAGGKISVEQWPAKAYRIGDAGAGSATVEKIANGWRVRTYVGTTLTDLSFVLEFSGI